MSSKVNIGVISYAHLHAPRYTAAIVSHPEARLAGIADSGVNAEVARAEAQRYNVPYFQNFEQLLEQTQLEAVYVGTEPIRHREVIADVAARRKHILCDKPIATTLEDADAILKSARDAGVKLMVPFNPRFQLPLITVKEALDSGDHGELIAIYAVKYGRLPVNAPGPQNAGWFLEPEQAGGGGFMDIGIHAIDALRWLANAEASKVYGQIGSMIHTTLNCDDLGTMTVEFENGVLAVLSAGWANPGGHPTWLDVRFEILTTKTVFLIKSPYHDFTIQNQQRTERRYWWRRDIHGLVDDFVQAILQNREPAITGEDARAALSIALAAYESARTGQVVEIVSS
ncbi:MAG TPA: Gfo/Idh/MocA family oxidoreductase [Anaerolineales bacterium]|jgi:predicted dehydrogenase